MGSPHLPLAEASTVRQGERVLAIGNPGDPLLSSITKGIVSALGRFDAARPGTWIQADAPIPATLRVREGHAHVDFEIPISRGLTAFIHCSKRQRCHGKSHAQFNLAATQWRPGSSLLAIAATQCGVLASARWLPGQPID
jgi:hypothetical protein